MKNRFKHSINYISVQIAITSLVIGTISLFLFKNSSDTGFVAIGYFFALVAGTINSLMLFPILLNSVRRLKDYKEHLQAFLLLLINIPLAGTYLEII